MAPAMSLSRPTGRPATGLTSSRRRTTTRRTVAAQATSDDRPNAALLTLSAGALLAQSAVVDPAAAAQLSVAPDQGVLTASQITASHSKKFTSATAPGVHFEGTLPAPVVGEVADLNADVRGSDKDYRDPAGAIQQDKFADKVKSGPSLGSKDLGDSVKDLGDSVKSGLKDIQKRGTDAVSALPTPAVGDLAGLNAGSGSSKGYRDPAGAVQQDKFADKVKSGPSLGTKDLGDSVKSGLKDAKKKATKAFSAVPTPAVGDLADQNADVRDTASGYRDPSVAVPQDKAQDGVSGSNIGSGVSTPDVGDAVDAAKSQLDKASKLFSAVPTPAVGDLADLNADVRDTNKNYRDPAGAVQQDKFADKVKNGPSLGSKDLGDSVKSGLKDIQKKAKDAVSALPTPAVGDLAGLNAGSGSAKSYRDPAGAVQQDKFADKVKSGPSLGTKDLGDSVKSGLKDVKKKATKAFSAVPTPAVGDLADLNADVRDLSKNYRDPAGSFQQDKFADKVKSGPSLGTKDLGDSVKSGLKDVKKNATKAFSAVPTSAVGDLADQNADVRDTASGYRDSSVAVPQDKAKDSLSGNSSGIGSGVSTPDVGGAVDAAKSQLDKASKLFSAVPTPAVGDLADLNADVRDLSKNYRDPAGSFQQDKFADKVKSGPSLGSKDLGDSVKSGLKDIQKKATDAVSALPTPAVGDLAGLNAGSGSSKSYRDPAGAVQQDKFADKVKSGPNLGTKDLGDSVKSGLKDAKNKATKAFSAVPTPGIGDLADLNADVRGDSQSYRDPAGAVQQDKFADKVKSGPSLGSKDLGDSVKDLGDSVKSGLKDIQKRGTDAVSALPTPAVGDLAGLNAGSGDSKSYRDPAGAVQQDKFADKVKSGPSLGTKDLGDSVKSGLKDIQRKATKAIN